MSLHYSRGLAPGDVDFAPAQPGSGCICGAAISQSSGLRMLTQGSFRYQRSTHAGLAVSVVDISDDAALHGQAADSLPDSELIATAALLGIPPAAPPGGTYTFERLQVDGFPSGRVDIGHALGPDGKFVDQVHWVVLSLSASRIYTFECQFPPGDKAAVTAACESAVASFAVR